MHDDAPTPDELARMDTAAGTPPLDKLAKHDVKARLFGEPAESARIGRYAVLRRIGAGGMGVVYSAYDDELDRKVAIKLVRGDHVGEQTVDRVRREAQALARLSHPNVVQVYEVERYHGQAYVAMEFVQGQTLRAYQEAPGRKTAEIVGAYVQAGRGLAAAHAAGLVHRDFKADNALVGDDGRVRVVDFGLARRDAGELEQTDRAGSPGHAPGDTRVIAGALTASGAVVGTPAYMSPEQLDGRPADARSDVFSFCVSLFEALYGKRPFAGQTPPAIRGAIARGAIEDPGDPRGVPAALRRALVRGLAEDPAARWPAMEPLLAALTADPGRRLRIAASAVLSVMLVGTGVYWLLQRAEAQRTFDLARESARTSAAESAARTASAAASRLERVGLARRLAARATGERERDPSTGLLLAIEAVEATRRAGEPATVEAEQALRDALDTVRSVRLYPTAATAAARIALSPDGRWAAVRDAEGAVRLWELGDAPRPAATLPAHAKNTSGHETLALSFTPDSRVLLDALPTGGARRIAVDAPDQALPDLATGGPARELLTDGSRALALHERGAALLDLSEESSVWPLALPSAVRDAGFGPDGERLLTVDADGAARLWSTRDGKPLRALRRAPIRRARGAWSPDGGQVLLAGPDRVAQLFPADGGAPRTLRGHTDEVYAVGFTADGAPLTLASDDTLRRWDEDGGSVRIDLVQHGEAVGGARLLPGSDLLLGTPYGGALWLWSAHERGAPMALLGHERSVTAVRVDTGGDRLLTAAYGDPSPRLWQWGDDPNVLRGHEGLIERLAWSPDGTRLLSAAIDGTARVWPLSGPPQVLRRHREDSSIAAAWRPDGRIVATAGSDGVARLWHVDGDAPSVVASLIGPVAKDSAVLVVPLGPGGKPARETPSAEPADTTPGLRDVAWSPAGDRLALAGEDGVIHLWSVGPGGAPADYNKMSLGTWPIDLVRFAPGGDLLACAGEDHDARLIPLTDGKPGEPIAVGGHAGPVRALAFAADGRRFATAGDDGIARVFALGPTPTLLRELTGHARGLWSIELTADGSRALTAGADGTARIWELDGTAAPAVLVGHGQAVLSASFSPDAGMVLTTSADGTARLWRKNRDDDGAWTSVALPHAGTSRPGELDRNVWAGVWRPDGGLVATAAADGVVRLFPVELPPLIAEACARAGRNLPRELLNQLFPDSPPAATCPRWPPP